MDWWFSEVSLVSTQYINMWTGGLVKWVWLPHNIIIWGLVVCEVSLISTQYNNMCTGSLWNEFGFHTIY